MSSFAIYNYQFAKIIRQAKEQYLFDNGPVEMDAEESFPQRQQIFGAMLDNDYKGEQEISKIKFINGRSDKEFIHRHLIPPTDDIIVMRVANVRTATYVNKDFNEDHVDDYQNCIVIIDNRPGIQRILIENRKRAFQDVKQVANIMAFTFNQLLKRFSLKIELMHLQESKKFWQYVEDRRSYPTGFYRISFHLPHLNLERLRKVYDSVLHQSRESFNSDLDWSFKANEGGQIHFDKNDERQRTLIEYMMEDVGSNNIKLYPNQNKRKAIIVGKDSFAAIGISESTIKRLEEDVCTGDLFGSAALSEIKIKTKTGIDP